MDSAQIAQGNADVGFDVIVYGTHSRDWTKALNSEAEIWKHIPGLREARVVRGEDPAALNAYHGSGHRTIVIPLMEPHIISCPTTFHSLFPVASTVRTLSDKRNFAEYAAAQRLDLLCPATLMGSEVTFPCVLKRLDLNAGNGIAIARSAEQLRSLLGEEPWLDMPYILQGFVESRYDYVTHAVCKQGRILWHSTYRYEINSEDPIRKPANTISRQPSLASDETIELFSRFLEPLKYDGPLNVDYRFDENGSLKIMEFNPRLGGSLMFPENISDLAAALTTIVENAYVS